MQFAGVPRAGEFYSTEDACSSLSLAWLACANVRMTAGAAERREAVDDLGVVFVSESLSWYVPLSLSKHIGYTFALSVDALKLHVCAFFAPSLACPARRKWGGTNYSTLLD